MTTGPCAYESERRARRVLCVSRIGRARIPIETRGARWLYVRCPDVSVCSSDVRRCAARGGTDGERVGVCSRSARVCAQGRLFAMLRDIVRDDYVASGARPGRPLFASDLRHGLFCGVRARPNNADDADDGGFRAFRRAEKRKKMGEQCGKHRIFRGGCKRA